jgi:hypothetical protein
LYIYYYPYRPGIQESTPQNHHGFAGGLLELHLDAGEFFMNNLDHSFDFFRCDWPGATLFSQQVHYVGSKFVTGLKQKKTAFCLIFWINLKRSAKFKD